MKANILRIGTTGTETRFLPENDLPECARLSGNPEDAIRQVEKMEMDKALAESRREADGAEGILILFTCGSSCKHLNAAFQYLS